MVEVEKLSCCEKRADASEALFLRNVSVTRWLRTSPPLVRHLVHVEASIGPTQMIVSDIGNHLAALLIPRPGEFSVIIVKIFDEVVEVF